MMTEENTRQIPNRGLILEATGGNVQFLEQAHHGLCETPIHALYPHLNLDELLVFEAGSWEFRNINSPDFRRLVKAGDIYNIFNRINQDGFPYLQKVQKLVKWENKHAELNPFGRSRTLKQRLERVAPDEVRKLLGRLIVPTNKYVFECQYHDAKKARDGDNFGLEILRFMPFYPKSGEVHAEKYASEIAAILREYPAHYVPVAKPSAKEETQLIQPETPRQEIVRPETRTGRRRKIDTQPLLFHMGWHE